MKPIKIKYRKNGTLLESAQIIQILKQGQRRVPSKEAGLFSLLGRTLRTFFGVIKPR